MNHELRIMDKTATQKPSIAYRDKAVFELVTGSIIRNSLFIIQKVRSILHKVRFALGWLALAVFASGCTLQTWIGTDPSSLELKDAVKFINNVITFLGAFGSLVVSFIMIAGYQSLMSAGSEEAATRAKDTIKYSAFGMVFLVFGYAIVKLIFASIAYGTNPFTNPFK